MNASEDRLRVPERQVNKQTVNSRQQTAESKQQTANSRKQTADSKQQTVPAIRNAPYPKRCGWRLVL